MMTVGPRAENPVAPYDILRDIHIGIGVVTLALFWVVAVLRKGTRLHRKLGDAYLLAMLGILLTATPMAAVAFVRGKPVLGAFLFYLLLVTGTATWSAFRAIRRRGSFKAYLAVPYRAVAWLNMGAGAAVLLLGVARQTPLLIGMSIIGLAVGYRMVALSAKCGTDRNWWIKQHFTGIVGSGAATHIAFLNLGLRHLVPASWFEAAGYLSWSGPIVVSTAVLIYLNRRFARFGERSDALPV
jgi:uncharacterized membrane protein